MVKLYSKTLFAAAALLFALNTPTVKAQDLQKVQPIEQEVNQISVTITGATLHVKNAEHCTLEIYSLTGERIYACTIDSSSKSIPIADLSRGYYIVRIGKYTRKIYVR